ncbi:DUF1501 domain-containing protein [Lignipirellula cremea]|uniref:Sulfatase n=1 Tax=Lignipirellula cremea TaxID=2528010 RepID=A0A518DUX3_9BACT|nr:DUF1501 domain-containing protein [Lignipirellula cremea]QDU95635.1 hypothetical protein Pla8534_34510 [Lignipirellula cremea]
MTLPDRRTFLSDLGMGFTGLSLAAMLQQDGYAAPGAAPVDTALPTGRPHFAPKAKSVIWLFMIGGLSQMEGFDPKPALNKYAGKTIESTPHADVLAQPYIGRNLRVVDTGKKIWRDIYPLQTGYRRFGESGVLLSDTWPHVGECVDDLCLIRSLWTTDDNHGAQLQFHTGRHLLDGVFPSLGSWVHYGLGTLNENLPQFVVLGKSLSERFGGAGGHSADYLGPEHDGVPVEVDPRRPLPFGAPPADVTAAEQEGEFGLLNQLHQLTAVEYPSDPQLRARIKSYELAFRMQKAMPEVFQFSQETADTQSLYGLQDPSTRDFGEKCLAARRMVERGVRFIQVYDGTAPGGGKWDTHDDSRKRLAENAQSVDKPIAGLLRDLKQRGLLEETLVCFMTEFGRSVGGQGAKATGREHSPYGFTVWMAGGGIRPGVHGATDELGFHAVENRHYVTDIHATVLHQLGLDPRRLEVPGHKRIEIDYGQPIREILG